MAKDPAFLFYSSDFLMGVSDLTMEERGKYITLLCLQHQKGPLSEKLITISVGEISADLRKKFDVDKDSNLFNKRLFDEANKRSNYTESRRKNATKTKKHMLEHMEDVNENVNIDEFKDVIETYKMRNPLFQHTWTKWLEYRKEIKKPYKSNKSQYGALKSIMAYDDVIASLMLQQSINNQWQGIFPLKTHNQQNDGTKTNNNNQQTGLANLNEQADRILSSISSDES